MFSWSFGLFSSVGCPGFQIIPAFQVNADLLKQLANVHAGQPAPAIATRAALPPRAGTSRSKARRMVGLLKSETEAMRKVAQNWVKQTCANGEEALIPCPATFIEAIEKSTDEEELEIMIDLLEEQAASSMPAAKRQKTAP